MIYVRPGKSFVVPIDGLPTGLVGTLGVRIVDPAGSVVLERTTDGVVEVLATIYAATIDEAPTDAGTYLAVVDDGAGESRTVLLTVTHDPPTPADGWTPTLEEIGVVVPAYTRGSFEDGPEAGAEHGTFDDTTSPTAETVERLIDLAVREIRGRVGYDIPTRCYDLARACATWHVAVTLTTGKLPDQADEASGQARGHQGRYLATLDDLKAQVRPPTAMRLA